MDYVAYAQLRRRYATYTWPNSPSKLHGQTVLPWSHPPGSGHGQNSAQAEGLHSTGEKLRGNADLLTVSSLAAAIYIS